MLTDVEALELYAAAAGGRILGENRKGPGGADVEGSGERLGRRNGLSVLRHLRKHRVDVNPGKIHFVLAGLGLDLSVDGGLNQAAHVAGGVGGAGVGGRIVNHNVVALVAAGGVVVDDNFAVDCLDRLRFGLSLAGVCREHRQQHAQDEQYG